MPQSVFEVDIKGMGTVARRRGLAALVAELYQNSVDEDGVKDISVSITSIEGRGMYELRVQDDAPNGFQWLWESYTLYAPSRKRDNAEKRGQFNIGEKYVVAACLSTGGTVDIVSTTGWMKFDAAGRHSLHHKQPFGTTFTGTIRTNRQEVDAALDTLRRVLPPKGVKLTVNHDLVLAREPVTSVEATLPTLLPGEEGVMRPTRRQTTVSLYEPFPDTRAMLYEMGIPVVETGDRYDVDVAQRVLLNQDRDNVTPGYLNSIRVIALNAAVAAQALTPDDATATWVAQATADKNVSNEAVRAVLDYRFGEKRVSYDLSDKEANNRAVAAGYNVIRGPMLSGAQWELARRAEAIKPAGQVTPSNSKWEYSPNGEPENVISPENWTPGMQRIVAHARYLADKLLNVTDLRVKIVNEPIRRNHALAAYGKEAGLLFNVGRLGYAWFTRNPSDPKVNELLIHEFAHHDTPAGAFPGGSEDHLSSKYHDALSDLGARMVQLALLEPAMFHHSDNLKLVAEER